MDASVEGRLFGLTFVTNLFSLKSADGVVVRLRTKTTLDERRAGACVDVPLDPDKLGRCVVNFPSVADRVDNVLISLLVTTSRRVGLGPVSWSSPSALRVVPSGLVPDLEVLFGAMRTVEAVVTTVVVRLVEAGGSSRRVVVARGRRVVLSRVEGTFA